MEVELYVYKAIVTDVYDGDTVTLDIDLGLNVWARGIKARLARIDTPELRGEERAQGLIVRDYVRSMILDQEVVVKTYKDSTGKYGRYIVEIFVGETNINDHLVENGMAILY